MHILTKNYKEKVLVEYLINKEPRKMDPTTKWT